MDIPCAIIIAAFCLPDVNLKMEVKSDISGSTAVVSFGEVRASIVLPDESAPQERTALNKQLCPADYCIPYAARLREDASAVDLLIGDPAGREHFVQIKGPVDQIAAIAGRMSFIYEMRGRWERVPLSEFRVDQPAEAPALSEAPPEDFSDERTEVLPDPPPLPPPEFPPEEALPAPPDVDEAPLPDVAPVPEFGPQPDTLTEPNEQAPPNWPRPNRPY